MVRVNRAEAIDVTDWDKTAPKGRLPQEYKDKGLTPNTIIINGVWFNGVSRDSSLGWEEFVWSEEPTRSNSFAFENMDDIDVGLVAQCQVNFKYFNIEDFKKFREAIKQRYFRCTFFNVDTGEWEYNREMYCSKSERQKLYYFNPKLLGVLDFSVTLVATNRELTYPTLTVTYELPNETKTVSGLKWGEQYVTNIEDLDNEYGTLKGWSTKPDGTGLVYLLGQSVTLFKDTTFYPVWNKTKDIDFNTASWDEIDAISKAGVFNAYFKVGDEKIINYGDNEQITLVILDFNHDDLSDGSGKAGITIGMKNVLKDRYPIHPKVAQLPPDNVGGWDTSTIRTETMPSLLSELPSELQNVIKSVNKKSNDGYHYSFKDCTIVESSDKLWLLSLAEIYSQDAIKNIRYSAREENIDILKQEGLQYEYYKRIVKNARTNSFITQLVKKDGDENRWWLRTATVNNNIGWYYIGENGSASIEYGSNDNYYSVSFCFCV